MANIANANSVGIGKGHRYKIFCFDFDNGEIAGRVGGHYYGLEYSVIRGFDVNRFGVLHHMEISDDRPVLLDDNAGS
jgi:hypothetical protein